MGCSKPGSLSPSSHSSSSHSPHRKTPQNPPGNWLETPRSGKLYGNHNSKNIFVTEKLETAINRRASSTLRLPPPSFISPSSHSPLIPFPASQNTTKSPRELVESSAVWKLCGNQNSKTPEYLSMNWLKAPRCGKRNEIAIPKHHKIPQGIG